MRVSLTSQFLVYLTLYRLAIITAGVVSIVLGYRLFAPGVVPVIGNTQESAVQVTVAGSGFTLKNAAPGTGFGLFGVILVTVMLVQGSPELTYETLQKAAAAAPANTAALDDTISTKVVMRGTKPGGSAPSLVQKGLEYEKAGDSAHAIDAYKEALSNMALPMNQLAWLYLQQGRTDDALPLARLAADLSPDDPAILETLAEVLAKHGDRPGAIRWMGKAADMDPQYRDKLAQLKQPGH
jgi:tetratricopeptide (TPR) repeat protein